jgi:hypothetical protein
MSVRKMVSTTILGLLLALCSLPAFGAEEVLLVYADRIEEVTILDAGGEEIFADFGTLLYRGYLISLGATSAELQYAENSTIVKLREGSTLKIDAFQEPEEPKSANKLSLVQGKMRTVAARLTESRYSVRTPSSALGVRGTDFIIEADPDILTVLSGQVEALDLQSDQSFFIDPGKQITIGLGIDGISEAGADLLSSLQENFSFSRLDPAAVPSVEGYSSDFDLRELWEDEEGEIQTLNGGSGSGRAGSSSADRDGAGSGSTSGKRGNSGSSATDSRNKALPGDSASGKASDAPSARLLATLEPGYTLFTSLGIKEISDGGFSILASFAGRIEGDPRIDLGFRVGAIFCTPKLDAVDSYTMIPFTFFAGLRRPITPLFYFGGEAGLGFQHLLFQYSGSTDFPEDQGFTTLVEAKLLGGLDLGFLQLELKVGLSGFFDNGFQSAIPISLGVSMGVDL